MQLRQGIVVATHPEDYSVDLVMLDDGSRVVGAQVMTMNGSARAGSVDLPSVGKKKDKWDLSERTDNEATAIVGMMRGNPVVMGFMYPQVSQMTFDDPDRRMSRHVSGAYQTVKGDGSVEFYHPSGAYVRISETTEHEDLDGKNFDKNLAATGNKDKKISIHVQAAGGKSSATIKEDGTVVIKADDKITCNTPLLEVPNGDVVAKGVSLVNHIHKGVQPGMGLSGIPVPGTGGGGGGGGGDPGTGPDYEAPPIKFGGTRQKYGEQTVWSAPSPDGDPNKAAFKRWNVSFPNNPSAISEELFYERFRFSQDHLIDSDMKTVISDYSPDADEFSEEYIEQWNQQDYFDGEIPSGVLDENVVPKRVYEAPYKVLTAEDGRRFVAYGFEFAQTQQKSHTSPYGFFSLETINVLYMLTEDEFQAGKVPPP